MERLVGYLGRETLALLASAGRVGGLISSTGYWTFLAPLRWRRAIRWGSALDQAVKMGVEAVPIVFLITFSTGLIIAMQSAYQLRRFGALVFTANLVGVAMTRELAPLITAIVVAGRSGSAIAAELGTMKVSEEVDALNTMGLNPVRFLVVPRMLALVLVLPCLTVFADFMGIFGGLVLAVTQLELGSARYLNQTVEALVLADFLTGLVKSFVFALIIGQVGCYQGLRVEGGAGGVGRNTTASVVASIFLIILADLIFTALFYFTG
ncbi:MAG: MlaE family ABC transporter permease [Nitrospinota bacterium]